MTTAGDAHQIRNMIRRGHRTSAGIRLRVEWRPVYKLQPGDVLAGLWAGHDNSRASAQLERALTARTWANVETVDVDNVGTNLTVTTRMGSKLKRGWLNRAHLPVLTLTSNDEETVSTSGQSLDAASQTRDDGTTNNEETSS